MGGIFITWKKITKIHTKNVDGAMHFIYSHILLYYLLGRRFLCYELNIIQSTTYMCLP